MWTNITLLSSHHAQLELLRMFIEDQDTESASIQYSICEKRFLELSVKEQRQEMATMEELKTQVEQLAA